VIAECGHLPHQEKTDEFIAGVNAITGVNVNAGGTAS